MLHFSSAEGHFTTCSKKKCGYRFNIKNRGQDSWISISSSYRNSGYALNKSFGPDCLRAHTGSEALAEAQHF